MDSAGMDSEPSTDSRGNSARRRSHVALLIVNVTIVAAAVLLVCIRFLDASDAGQRGVPDLGTNAAPLPPRLGARDGGLGAVRARGARGRHSRGPNASESAAATGAEAGGDAATGDTVLMDGAASAGAANDEAGDDGAGTDRATDGGPTAEPARDRGVTPSSADEEPTAAADRGPPPPLTAPLTTSLGPRTGPVPVRLRGHVDDRPGARTPDLRGVVGAAAEQAQASTESIIDALGVHLEVIHEIGGAYPSSAAASAPEYGGNLGIEVLHAALAKLGRTAGMRLGDTDDDGRMEVLDAWGRPLVYFSPDDYGGASQRWVPGDGDAVDVAARRASATGAFRARSSFQLFSAGPNGRLEARGGDDVTSWVSRD